MSSELAGRKAVGPAGSQDAERLERRRVAKGYRKVRRSTSMKMRMRPGKKGAKDRKLWEEVR